jgi:hypothetical protein
VPLLLLLTSTACFRPAADARAAGSWSYEVEAPVSGSRVVVVEATFENARTARLAIAPSSAPFVRDLQLKTQEGWSRVERTGEQWLVPACARYCTVRYRIDLGEVAAACGDEVDCARRVGDATLSPALAWLAYPSPKTDVPVTVRVHTPDVLEFMSGMRATDESGHAFAFRSYDLDEGSFTAFGPMRRLHANVASPSGEQARIDIALVGNAGFGMTDDNLREWVGEAARIVTPLFGRFPVERSTLFVVPAKGESEVVFGKVLSLAGASVVVVVGENMPAAARRRDWVLVHELFHLGFPTFRGEGRWLGEGLATYYEPVLRARAGWTTEAEVYRQFARNMPRGLPAIGSSSGLAHRDDLDSIYWGGALFCFAADVRIREATHGRHSLDDVVRAALARGGDATQVWTVAQVVKLGDDETGTTVLSEMYDRYAARGERMDIDGLFASLGIDRDGNKVDRANGQSLAWIRQSIVGRPHPSLAAKVPSVRPVSREPSVAPAARGAPNSPPVARLRY